MSTFAQLRKEIEKTRFDLEQEVERCKEAASTRKTSESRRSAQFQEDASRLQTVVHRAQALTSDLMATRQGDMWALTFSNLVQASLVMVSNGLLGGIPNVSAAGISNLKSLCQALDSAFPDGRRTLTDLKRSLQSLESRFGPISSLAEPHPLVDTLASQILTLRDSGYRIQLRELHFWGEKGVHVVRPA